MPADDLLIVAGEASGDLHGARLLAELRALRPSLRPFGLGAGNLRAAGLDALADSAAISAVGLAEVAKVLRRARAIYRRLLAAADERRPAVAVLIDFPEFNIPLSRRLAERGVRVVYYVSPQIWAWRRGRARALARSVTRMLVLFPFEVPFYEAHDVPVEWVGHPLVDEVPALEQAWDAGPPPGGTPYRIALLPGSRRSEVRKLLPAMVGAVARLEATLPVRARLVLAPTIEREWVEELLRAPPAPRAGVEVVTGDRFGAIADAHLALCASGTATLETGMLGTPLLVLYQLGLATYGLGLALLRVRHVSLVNLLLGTAVVPELIQRQARPGPVAATAAQWLGDPAAIAGMRARLAELRPRLGEPGASRRAAAAVAAVLAEAAA
jgi:lipid-A-disaccharide synthase